MYYWIIAFKQWKLIKVFYLSNTIYMYDIVIIINPFLDIMFQMFV